MACLHPLRVPLALLLLLGGCPSDPEVSGDSSGSTSSTSTGPDVVASSSGPGSTSSMNSTTAVATGGGTSTGPGMVDSSGSDTTAAGSSSGESSGSSTGELPPSPVGCADGFREALLDEGAYPDIAACAGGFGVPGVTLGGPVCERQGGDDGLMPDGMGCSIDDLCAAGWHLCADQVEVLNLGLTNCDNEPWNDQFFATGQSGEGSNTCGPTGANDVFGCGDIGFENISSCSPLNRSTGNLCVELSGPWQCGDDGYDEASNLLKPGPTEGGALCCRD